MTPRPRHGFNPYIVRATPRLFGSNIIPSHIVESVPWTEALPDVEVAPDGTPDGERDSRALIVPQTFVRPQRLHVFSAKRAGVLKCEWCGAPRERVRRVCEFCGKRVHHAYRAAAHDLLVVSITIGCESFVLLRRSDGSIPTYEEVREWLLDRLQEGKRRLPVGEPCEGFSYETGCPGHEEPPT